MMAKANAGAEVDADTKKAAWHENEEVVREIIGRYPRRRSALMPLLHLAQQERGYLAPEDLANVGELIGETQAYVESVASFYTLYRRKPHGRFTLTVCENLSCALCGGEELSRHLKKRLGVGAGETTPDGLFTLEPTGECLAACDGAPAMQVNLDYYLGVTPAKADELLHALRKEAAAEASGPPGAADGPRVVSGSGTVGAPSEADASDVSTRAAAAAEADEKGGAAGGV